MDSLHTHDGQRGFAGKIRALRNCAFRIGPHPGDIRKGRCLITQADGIDQYV